MNPDFDIIVIGAGVIGLACAAELSGRGHAVLIVDKENTFGLHTSSRNTGVIHAGVYYDPATLKAKLCHQGRDALYAYCQNHGILHRKIGKLFVATCDEAMSCLDQLVERAADNGIDGVRVIGSSHIRELEPALKADAAVFCPHTGVVDTHQLMLSLLADAEQAGAVFAANSGICDATNDGNIWTVFTEDDNRDGVTGRVIVNAAGLSGLDLAKHVFPDRDLPQAAPAKGAFLRYVKNNPLSHAIYPDLIPGVILPRVDATPGLDGVLRFGPATDPAMDEEDYSSPPDLIERQLPHIQRYLPDVEAEDLTPDYVGVRPKVRVPDKRAADFQIAWSPEPGWLDLFNMESPGLTSSLAVSAYVADLVDAA